MAESSASSAVGAHSEQREEEGRIVSGRSEVSCATSCDTAVVPSRYTELQYHRLASTANVYGLCSVKSKGCSQDPLNGGISDSTNQNEGSQSDGRSSVPAHAPTPPAVVIALCNQRDDGGMMGNGLVRLVNTNPRNHQVVPSFEWLSLSGVNPADPLVSVAGYAGPDGKLVLGVTSMKRADAATSGTGADSARDSTGTTQAELHLFEFDPSNEVASSAEKQCHIPLDFIPFCLEEVILPTGQHGFLLSGKCRLFFVPAAELVAAGPLADDDLPHLSEQAPLEGIIDTACSATAIKIERFGEYHVVAVGYQDGCCQLAVTRPQSTEPLTTCVNFDGPVTSLVLFEVPHGGDSGKDPPLVQLVVGCALESAVVYVDVIRRGLEDVTLLPQSDQHDSVLCVRAITAPFDGFTEIVVGTYGQTLLGYRCRPVCPAEQVPPSAFPPEPPQPQDNTSFEDTGKGLRLQFELAWQHRFAHPIYSVQEVDVTADGVAELVVLSMFGLHLLQHDFAQLDRHAQRVLELMREVDALEQAVKSGI
eukprot:m.24708 g.24708  ORF g.24708 m.24708 type:complete len:534 (-) comp6110_c0_seq1:638-2239(-)